MDNDPRQYDGESLPSKEDVLAEATDDFEASKHLKTKIAKCRKCGRKAKIPDNRQLPIDWQASKKRAGANVHPWSNKVNLLGLAQE